MGHKMSIGRVADSLSLSPPFLPSPLSLLLLWDVERLFIEREHSLSLEREREREIDRKRERENVCNDS